MSEQNVTEHYAAYRGDCIDLIKDLPDDSIGLSVFSPPFPGMYAYTDSPRDIGNCKSIDEMLGHFEFLIPELLRVLMPGRRACVHLTQSPAFKWADGYIGLKDFRGRVISLFEKHGFIYYGEHCINKCPQVKAARTNDSTLQMKTFVANSENLRPALADYVLYFKKAGDSPNPICAGTHPKYPDARGWLTPEEWIAWAAPCWTDIRESDVLNVKQARDGDDEKHLCPLQLSVIDRCVSFWSAPGETVFSPFMGIGSEGYKSIELGRRFIGFELKPSYFKCAVDNLDLAVSMRESSQYDLLADRAAV